MSGEVFRVGREPTGIVKVDEMLEGGFPKGGVVGISGSPGVGKSIFSLHFILEGARRGEKSVYINLEEPRRNVDNMVKGFEFGKEFLEFEKKGLIVVKCFDYNKYERVQEDLFAHIKKDKEIKRLVIDSFNCFFAANGDFDSGADVSVKKKIVEIFYKLRRDGLTTVLTLEREGKDCGRNYNIPYLVDGIVKLDFLDLGTIERRIFIPKMRWTSQCKDSRSYEICGEGVVIGEDSWE
ncbi:AAA family ATPase [Methanococcoides sp. SA1]|nr:AAA family ATPase [Methanococcoides sp. SA1]